MNASALRGHKYQIPLELPDVDAVIRTQVLSKSSMCS